MDYIVYVVYCRSKIMYIDLQVFVFLNQYLRDYQREGIQFLYDYYREGEGAVFGDDMGLGKIVQVSNSIGKKRRVRLGKIEYMKKN